MTKRDIVYAVPLTEDEALEKIAEYPLLEAQRDDLVEACEDVLLGFDAMVDMVPEGIGQWLRDALGAQIDYMDSLVKNVRQENERETLADA